MTNERILLWGPAERVLTAPVEAPLRVAARRALPDGAMLLELSAENPAVGFALAAGVAMGSGLDAARLPADFRLSDYGLMCSDMDGTLIDDEVFGLLTAEIGRTDAYRSVMRLVPMLPPADGLNARAALLRGMPGDKPAELTPRLRKRPGVARWTNALSRAGVPMYVVSSGIESMALALARELGMDGAAANRLVLEDGLVKGVFEGPVDPAALMFGEAKASWLSAKAASLGGVKTIAVGDTGNDVPMLRRADLAVAVGGNPRAASVARVHLNSGRYDLWTDVLEAIGAAETD